jgi:predicted transcriptional regulator
MSFANHAVSGYMTSKVWTASSDQALSEITEQLATRHFSAVPILDDRGSIVGVVSRTDLLHNQRQPEGKRAKSCGDLMSQGPLVIELNASLRDAAKLMVQHRVHRLFVVEHGRLCGVISTTDLTRAVEDARVMDQLHTIMSSPVATIDVEQALSVGQARLDDEHFTGLVVTENDWPVGVFTQEEALAGKDAAANTTIGSLLDPALVCLPMETALHRAAAQCARMGVRRIVVSKHRDFVGVVSGLDFARVVANA